MVQLFIEIKAEGKIRADVAQQKAGNINSIVGHLAWQMQESEQVSGTRKPVSKNLLAQQTNLDHAKEWSEGLNTQLAK